MEQHEGGVFNRKLLQGDTQHLTLDHLVIERLWLAIPGEQRLHRRIKRLPADDFSAPIRRNRSAIGHVEEPAAYAILTIDSACERRQSLASEFPCIHEGILDDVTRLLLITYQPPHETHQWPLQGTER